MGIAKGVYVLVISVDRDIIVNVGALGRMNFKKGMYAYVGSAKNNLEKRVERHLRKAKRKFWHIDYLLGAHDVKVLEVFSQEGGKEGECKIARSLNEENVAIQGFGSSDCKCKSHLFKIEEYQF